MKQPPKYFRWFAVGLFAFSAIGSTWYASAVLDQARNRKNGIAIMPGMFAGLVAFGLLGLFLSVTGDRGFYFVQKRDGKWSKAQGLLIGIIVALSFVAYYLLSSQLTALGYE